MESCQIPKYKNAPLYIDFPDPFVATEWSGVEFLPGTRTAVAGAKQLVLLELPD